MERLKLTELMVFFYEYVQIPDGTTEMTITFASKESICDMHVYSKGSVPEDVQTWKTPCDNADILVFATHADDEILFPWRSTCHLRWRTKSFRSGCLYVRIHYISQD